MNLEYDECRQPSTVRGAVRCRGGFAWQLLGVFRLLPWMAQGHGVLDVNE